MIKVGDYIKTKPFLGSCIFAKVKKIEELDGGALMYVVEGPEGEYNCYSADPLSKKEAKNWIDRLNNNIKFLKQI